MKNDFDGWEIENEITALADGVFPSMSRRNSHPDRASYRRSLPQNGNAALADGAPPMPLTAECCKTGPDATSIANWILSLSCCQNNSVDKGVEGLEPSCAARATECQTLGV